MWEKDLGKHPTQKPLHLLYRLYRIILASTKSEDVILDSFACRLFRLRNKGSFQIWKKETLNNYGFIVEYAPYYVVLHFDNTDEINIPYQSNLKQKINYYHTKIRPLSDIVGIV